MDNPLRCKELQGKKHPSRQLRHTRSVTTHTHLSLRFLGSSYLATVKKLQVQLDDQTHSLLKDYANAWDMTMSEICAEALRSYMHKHSRDCGYIRSLFQFKNIKPDPRITKSCYGHPCLVCKHVTACRCGLHGGQWEMDTDKELYGSFGKPLDDPAPKP